jgi:hypothetical protein
LNPVEARVERDWFQRLKLEYDEMLSIFAFNFNFRRYTGGTFVMSDNNPKSAVIQNLPPALFTLMKSTEPHSNEYYQFDIEGMLREHGFEHVHTEDTDPRHRTVLGTRRG